MSVQVLTNQVLHWRLWTRFVLHLTELARVCPSKTCLFVIENPSHGKKNVEELTRMAFDVLKFHSIYVGSQPGLLVVLPTQPFSSHTYCFGNCHRVGCAQRYPIYLCYTYSSNRASVHEPIKIGDRRKSHY